MATKIANYIEAHPKLVEYGIPAVTFITGLFTGKKAEQLAERGQEPATAPAEPQQSHEEIDFNNIPD